MAGSLAAGACVAAVFSCFICLHPATTGLGAGADGGVGLCRPGWLQPAHGTGSDYVGDWNPYTPIMEANRYTNPGSMHNPIYTAAVLTVLSGNDATLAKDIAMHIAASRPECVSEKQLSNELLEREKAIFIEQAKESGKPDNIIEKMIVGRMKKFVNEVTLYGQAFIKDPETSVGELVKSKNAEVESFVRFEVGEGIEKKEDNFLEEVMAQIQD